MGIELDNGRYTLEANLKAENRDSNEIAILMSEWDHYQRILVRGGSFEEFQSRTQNLMKDSFFNSNDFQMTEDILNNIQGFFQSGAMQFDSETNLAIMYPGLKTVLSKIDFPVLTILGRKDTQIDWKAVGKLYRDASQNGKMPLTLRLLDNCNHVMQKTDNGGLYEDLPPDTPSCEGYYQAMDDWLKDVSLQAEP